MLRLLNLLVLQLWVFQLGGNSHCCQLLLLPLLHRPLFLLLVLLVLLQSLLLLLGLLHLLFCGLSLTILLKRDFSY
jgi:hypothetical protein